MCHCPFFPIHSLLQATDYLVTKGSFRDIERAFSDVSDKIGVLISSISASYHHRCAFLKKISVSPVYEIESLTSSFPQDALTSATCRPNVLPYTAPILVMKEARLSSDLSQCTLLKKAMKDMFREYWQRNSPFFHSLFLRVYHIDFRCFCFV